MTELDGRPGPAGWRLGAIAAGLVLANAAPALAATYNTGASAPTSTTLWAYTEGNPPAPAPACHGVALSIKVPTGSLELTDMAFEIAPIQPPAFSNWLTTTAPVDPAQNCAVLLSGSEAWDDADCAEYKFTFLCMSIGYPQP